MLRVDRRLQDRGDPRLGKTVRGVRGGIEASLRHRRQRVSGGRRKAGLWPRGTRHLRASGALCVLAAEATAGEPAKRPAANLQKARVRIAEVCDTPVSG